MHPKVNVIVAVCENMGIGLNGDLPWKLKNEMSYFTRMTRTTKDTAKKNAVVMGRKTWDSIPPKYRPLAGRLNVVLTKQNLDLGSDAIVCHSLDSALEKLRSPAVQSEMIETIWIIGGSSVYKEGMASPFCHRIYLTKVLKDFPCDTFLPDIPSNFNKISDPDVPEEMQEENGIQYTYNVYEKSSD